MDWHRIPFKWLEQSGMVSVLHHPASREAEAEEIRRFRVSLGHGVKEILLQTINKNKQKRSEDKVYEC